ncbi:uncharacterized protein METZ01_LOCUS48167 [marine metagenome]|uniref:DUF349 domain-containing protein n=1 Tax=marine metagenome TaxID=408172 RepID=A0A381S2E9_9ZZZZ
MNLLDRFRGQPEWQNDDPSVRASAVDGLEDEAQELFLAIAMEDTDPGVRTAAVLRLSNPVALTRVVQADRDAGVRTEASVLLRDMAVGADNPEEARVALAGLSELGDLSDVARNAKFEEISQLALVRVDAQKTLASVSRRAVHPAVRLAALARVTDRDELVAVAIKSDHKNVALGAFERLSLGDPDDRALLKMIAVQARTKAVARRGRAVLDALDAEPPTPLASDPQRQREQLCETLETLTDVGDRDLVNQRLAAAQRQWTALDALDGDLLGAPSREELVARWINATAQIQDHLLRIDREETAADRLRRLRAEALLAREALCEQLAASVSDEATVPAGGLVDEVVRLRTDWDALPPIPEGVDGADRQGRLDDSARDDDEGLRLERRFSELLARAEGAVHRRQSHAERRTRLTELVEVLEEAGAEGPVDELERRWTGPHTEWLELARSCEPDQIGDLTTRVEAADAKRLERLTAARNERKRREEATLAKQQRRCEELARAVGDEKLELKDAERYLRTTQSLLRHPGRVPTRQDRDALVTRLREAQSGLVGRVRELRGLTEWKQWANLGVQESLCRRLEALASVTDDAVLAKGYQQVMEAWRQASEVQRGEGEEVFQRFKVAHDAVRPRVEERLAKEESERQKCLEQKVALCLEAENLSDSTDWLATAKRIEELQAEWKRIGQAAPKPEREVWNRFRAASGQFFRRRRADLVERKQIWAKNAALKETLCQQAEALSEELDLPSAKGTVRRLQAEWKAIGPVRRNRSETLWARFRSACDQVYTRAEKATEAEFADKIAARAALCERLEALAPESEAGDPPAGLGDLVAATRSEWRQLPRVPQSQDRSLSARFEVALARVVEQHPDVFSGTDLDPQRNLHALERLCGRVEALVAATTPEVADERSPAELLAAQLREALASNTMGAKADLDAKRRADADEVKRLQSERNALGVVPGETGRQLSDRFRAACERFFRDYPEVAERTSSPRGGGGSKRRRRRSYSDSGSPNNA